MELIERMFKDWHSRITNSLTAQGYTPLSIYVGNTQYWENKNENCNLWLVGSLEAQENWNAAFKRLLDLNKILRINGKSPLQLPSGSHPIYVFVPNLERDFGLTQKEAIWKNIAEVYVFYAENPLLGNASKIAVLSIYDGWENYGHYTGVKDMDYGLRPISDYSHIVHHLVSKLQLL